MAHARRENGNALLRIDGQVFEVRTRHKGGSRIGAHLSELARKYMGVVPPIDDEVLAGMHQQVSSNNLWVFELVGRS